MVSYLIVGSRRVVYSHGFLVGMSARVIKLRSCGSNFVTIQRQAVATMKRLA